jgi:hypothetical protein
MTLDAHTAMDRKTLSSSYSIANHGLTRFVDKRVVFLRI